MQFLPVPPRRFTGNRSLISKRRMVNKGVMTPKTVYVRGAQNSERGRSVTGTLLRRGWCRRRTLAKDSGVGDVRLVQPLVADRRMRLGLVYGRTHHKNLDL